MTGARWERELIERLGEQGWTAMRAPASGAATVRDLPDVLALTPIPDAEYHTGNPASWTLAIEAKYRSDSPAYFDLAELEALERFAQLAGANPYIGVRWSGTVFGETDWRFAHPGDIETTETKAKLEFEVTEAWERVEAL